MNFQSYHRAFDSGKSQLVDIHVLHNENTSMFINACNV